MMDLPGDFPRTLAEYAAERDALLARITAGLQADRRVAAAWLAGSMGRGEHDEVSDIDLFVVLEDEAAKRLCAHPQMVNAGSLPERLALFSAFGEPANLHENHNNAPPGGSFSGVLYSYPPVIVDWTLLPLATARRPANTHLLFERTLIPPELPPAVPPLDPDERAARLAERAAFFWMLAAVTAKYIQRGAQDAAQVMFGYLGSPLAELEQLLDHDASEQPAPQTLEEMRSTLRALCERVEALGVPAAPRAQVEAILNLER